jgi:hypothetical protein
MLSSQFSAIFTNFGDKNGGFIKSRCYDQLFAKTSSSLRKNDIFSPFFCRTYFKNQNIGHSTHLKNMIQNYSRQCYTCTTADPARKLKVEAIVFHVQEKKRKTDISFFQ